LAKKSSEQYWREREAEQLKHNIRDEKEYRKQIEEIYDYMLDNIQKEIDSFYRKYAKAEGITMAEAKRRVSELDIKEYERKAKRYVKEKDFSDQANEEMRLYNATMKINRLEMLKANIGLEMAAGFDELQKYFEQTLTDKTLEEFERQAGILGKTVHDNAKTARSIVNASFHNATYSNRIWMYQDMMKAELSTLLQQGLIQGKHPRELTRHLEKRFGVAKNNAERLMVTELARVQTEAQKQSFEENGYDEYQFHAIGTVCEDCLALDGKHFPVKKMVIAQNAPPMHPRCRCSISAYMGRAEFEKWLDGQSGSKKMVAKFRVDDKIKSRKISVRNMSNGLRTSPYHILSDSEIESIRKDAMDLKIPQEVLRFNAGSQTGFSDRCQLINIRGDILPDLASSNTRDRLSQKCVLAHEYYGHYKNHPSAFRVGDWRDEFRASYRAAIDAPELSDEERRMLMLDAYDRAKEAGVNAVYNKIARRFIYGYDD